MAGKRDLFFMCRYDLMRLLGAHVMRFLIPYDVQHMLHFGKHDRCNGNDEMRERFSQSSQHFAFFYPQREDLLVEVAKIASQGFDYLIIESSGVSEPMPVVETFTFQDATGMSLGDVARIDTLVTVVDGSKFLSELNTILSLRERGWHTTPEDQRTISHLLCDQVEFANVIVINKCDLISMDEKGRIESVIKQMNPSAKLIESVHSKIPLEYVLGTGLFSLTEVETHARWLKEARIGEHTPETIEYGELV